MEKRIKSFDIIDHGYDHSKYFRGCGTAYSVYDLALTGCGDNASEAYADALEQAYQVYGDAADKLPRRPRGINAKNKVPARLANAEDSEYWYYVSIRIEEK